MDSCFLERQGFQYSSLRAWWRFVPEQPRTAQVQHGKSTRYWDEDDQDADETEDDVARVSRCESKVPKQHASPVPWLLAGRARAHQSPKDHSQKELDRHWWTKKILSINQKTLLLYIFLMMTTRTGRQGGQGAVFIFRAINKKDSNSR